LAAYPLRGERLNEEHLPILLQLTESAELASRGKAGIVIGGGLGRSEETKEVVKEYIKQTSIPIVIDADAIHALENNVQLISGKPFLITPHLYEFLVLTGKDVAGLPLEGKMDIVKREANRLKTTILLKGPVDIISDGKEVALSRTGSFYMTKGGMGDTLAGIAGALMSRDVEPFEAGQAAAYINGLAGEIAVKKFGESVMASDLIDAIPEAIRF